MTDKSSLALVIKWLIPSGAGLIAQQAVEPLGLGVVERLGVSAVVVIGAFVLVRYFMGVVEKKDARIEALHQQTLEISAQNTRLLVEELKRAGEGREALIETLGALTERLPGKNSH